MGAEAGLMDGVGPPGGAGLRGCLAAVLGPSGAGKTTLLDVLAGRRSGPGLQGEVRLNGHLLSSQQRRQVVGYVQQDDVLPGTLTVYEYLLMNAALRLPPDEAGARGGSSPRHLRQVWSLVQSLGLSKVAHSTIGDAFVRGLSGGEKRRVSIAVELLTRPAVLLLDEPTTGLDSSNAARVVDILAGLAQSGVTVLLSIHQPRPDIFRLMDRLLLLSGLGETVYSGPVRCVGAHLASLGRSAPPPSVALPDFLLDMVIRSSREEVVALVDGFGGSLVAEEDGAWAVRLASAPGPPPLPKYCAPFTAQFLELSGRLLRNTYRHPFLVTVNFVATLAAAVTMGLLFRNSGLDTGGIQNRLGSLFFALLFLSLLALSSLPVWREERLLFRRERAAGLYATPAYFAAVVLFDLLPLRVIPPFFFALFAYPVIGLHPSCAVCILRFIGVLVAANVSSTLMCMAIGAASPSNSVANMVASLALMLFMLFGGFLLNKERVPSYCRALSATSFFNYAYEALVINEFHAFPADFFFTTPLATSVLPPLRITGDGVLREFGFNQANLSHDVHMLLLLAGGWGALTYCLLLLLGSGSAECWREEARRAGRAAWARLLAASSAASGYPLHSPCPSDEEEEGGPGGGGGEEGPAGIQQVDRGGGGRAGSRGGAGGQRLHGSEPSPLLPAALTPTAAVHAARPLTSCSGAWFPNRAGGGAPGGQASAGQPGLSLTAGPGGAGGGAVLSWENVSCSVAGGRGAAGRRRAILKAVSGTAGPTCWPGGPGAQGGLGGDGLAHVQPGGVQAGGAAGGAAAAGPSCLMAILGPSGAGKTTLLDILAGRRSRLGVSGELRLNGQLVSAEQLRHVSGYVHQDAVLPGTSTVAEYLQFHATLRMPAGTPPSHIEARVSAVIAQLGLSKVAHSTIGDAFVRGLSGGEKRRVSIAVELLTRPAVLLLDEPTTGLDSSNAARVVDILAGLAQSGVTVLLSIHQPRPDIFRLMDRLLLLSGDGQVVFTGPSAAAESHFAGLGHTVVSEEQSMADYVLDLIIKVGRGPSRVAQ
ncbi:P-loop containing nucleoside triphosphate hydrolase protein [Haematococcus lacustris]